MPKIPVFISDQPIAQVPAGPREDPNQVFNQLRGAGEFGRAVTAELTRFGQARQLARKAADLNRANLLATEALSKKADEMQAEDFKVAEQKYTDYVTEERDKFSESIVDPEVRDNFLIHYDRMAAANLSEVRKNAFKREVDQGLSDLDKSVNLYTEELSKTTAGPERFQLKQQIVDTLENAAKAGFITPLKGQQVLRESLASADETRGRADIYVNPGLAMARLKKEPIYLSDLPADRRQAMLELATQRFDALVTEQAQAAEKAKREAEKQAKHDNQISLVQGAYDGTGPSLDPKNADHREAVETYYNEVVAPKLQQMPPDEQIKTVLDFTAKTGAIPELLKGNIRGSLRASDPGKVLLGSDLLQTLKAENPQVLNDFTDPEIEIGEMVFQYTRGGMTPQQAVELAKENLKTSKEVRDARNLTARKLDLPKKNLSYINDEFGGGFIFGRKPKLTQAMKDQFNTLVDAHFLNTGEIKVAQKLAAEELNRVWGVTKIGSDTGKERWMYLAPEQVYSDQTSPGWIEEQLLEDVSGVAKVAPEKLKNRVLLEADFLSTQEFDSSGYPAPSYPVMVLNDQGEFVPVMGEDNRPIRFRPDWRSSKRRAIIEKERQTMLETARKSRLDAVPSARKTEMRQGMVPAKRTP